MEARPHTVINYRTADGREPVAEWFHNLRDPVAKTAIDRRIKMVRLGSLGHTDNIGEGVQGLKVDVGPGYRVYFGQDGPTFVILLCGGDKHTQDRDGRLARQYWKDYKATRREGGSK
jgi:putative addiction module killer protein